jgi:hypothetical protein
MNQTASPLDTTNISIT